jgi:hypothetical protein
MHGLSRVNKAKKMDVQGERKFLSILGFLRVQEGAKRGEGVECN